MIGGAERYAAERTYIVNWSHGSPKGPESVQVDMIFFKKNGTQRNLGTTLNCLIYRNLKVYSSFCHCTCTTCHMLQKHRWGRQSPSSPGEYYTQRAFMSLPCHQQQPLLSAIRSSLASVPAREGEQNPSGKPLICAAPPSLDHLSARGIDAAFPVPPVVWRGREGPSHRKRRWIARNLPRDRSLRGLPSAGLQTGMMLEPIFLGHHYPVLPVLCIIVNIADIE